MSRWDRPGSELIAIRAFRGTKRSSVYREHVVSESAFSRIRDAAGRAALPLLPSLDPRGRRELDKAEARQLADEATNLRTTGELTDLDDDLTAIAEVARWGGRASDRSWVRIAAP